MLPHVVIIPDRIAASPEFPQPEVDWLTQNCAEPNRPLVRGSTVEHYDGRQVIRLCRSELGDWEMYMWRFHFPKSSKYGSWRQTNDDDWGGNELIFAFDSKELATHFALKFQ